MDFGLNEGQSLLRAAARAFLERECPEAHVRAMEDDEFGLSRTLWHAMGESGWHGIAIPERYGGAALGFLDLLLLTEVMGRVLLPEPFVANALCAALLVLAGTDAQREKYLPGIASGAAIHTPALLEETADWRPEAITVQRLAAGGRYTVNGTKLFVPHATAADYLHVWTRNERGALAVVVLSRGQPGLTFGRMPTIARDHQFEVGFADVAVDAADVISVNDATAQRWRSLGMTLECAYLLGMAERSLEMTVAYASERKQFGHPIGAFQAVQHRAANMRIDVDGMRAATYRAGWSVSENEPGQHMAAAMAKAFCSDASRRVAGHAQQIHGGIGFTREYAAQLYFRRQKRGELAWGDAAFQRERMAELWTSGQD